VATAMAYECGFEDTDDLSPWKFNAAATPNAGDHWMVGTAVHSTGKRSLYISKDGTDPNYGSNRNVVVSYLRYKFPTSATSQPYDISFDWKGEGDSTTSKLYVMACPEILLTTANSPYNLSTMVTLSPLGHAELSTQTKNQCLALGASGEKFVCGSESWQSVSLTHNLSVAGAYSGYTYAILFVWVNDNASDTVTRSSIAIDNVVINSAALKKPTNLDVIPQCEDSTMLVTWESGLHEFDVEYRAKGESNWRRSSGLMEGMPGFSRTDGTKCSFVLTRILEGGYDVRVRGKADGLYTGWIYKTNILVYCPENHCINYIDLYSPNVVCTYGGNPEYHAGATPYDNVGVVDDGPDQETSRHTLHVDPEELDPRTDSLLHTVPDGALASVRLGNWKYGGEAEAITYDITVDSASQGILIVKYAVVLENPGDWHKKEEEPRFDLIVLDEAGQPIDELCGQALFYYSDGANGGWNITKDNNVAWKDWTTVGLNLMPYHGRTIKVRFITYDCGQGGHYAYAYFTVDCANAHIETNNCGNDASISCKAPDGFKYEWRDETGLVIDSVQELKVDAGRHTYTCRVSFIEQPGCYFEISTVSAPRFPVPDYTFERVYGECQSKLKFTNTSHVMTMWDGDENHTAEPCTDFHWEFRHIETEETKMTDAQSPIYLCPELGGSIEVKYTCYIGAENSCDSTRIDTIMVPNIIPADTISRQTTCYNAPVKFDGKWFDTDTVYKAVFPSFAGCDSVSTLYLKVYPDPGNTYRHDSICSDRPLVINGVKYSTPMDNELIMLKTVNGCDSAIYLTLTVNERINAHVDTLSFVCADDDQMYLTFDITAGMYDSLGITFNTPTLRDTMIYEQNLTSVAIPYPDTITPGVYQAELTFYQFCCGQYTQIRDVEIRYRSSIVEQKWNDVLTVLSPKYNGGFEFTAFQWYKDGQPLLGETHSYLYQPLETSSVYYVELTRADGLVMTTCPIQPEYHEQQTPYPTVVTAGNHMPVYMEQAATIWYYTMSGQLYSTFGLPQGYTTLPVPEQTGAYVIRSVNAQGEAQAQVMIVQ